MQGYAFTRPFKSVEGYRGWEPGEKGMETGIKCHFISETEGSGRDVRDRNQSHSIVLYFIMETGSGRGSAWSGNSAEIERVIWEYRKNLAMIREFYIGCDVWFSAGKPNPCGT